MRKRSRKLVSILLTLALLATLLVPMATPAAAACTYTMSNVAVVTAGGDRAGSMGTLRIQGDSTFAKAGKYVYLTLPSSPSGYSMTLTASAPANVNGNPNALATSDITLERLSGGRQYKVTINNVTNSGNDAAIELTFDNLYIPSGVSGDVVLTIDAPSSSTFTGNTSIVIAKVNPGSVLLTTENVPSIGDTGGVSGTIRVKETNEGGLTGSPILKFKLPSGFVWEDRATPDNFTAYWGKDRSRGVPPSYVDIDVNTFTWEVSSDGRTLSISKASGVDLSATFWSFNWFIDVDDPSVAKTGDVTVTVSGDSSAAPSSLVVAKYGELGATISAVDAPELVAGKAGQNIGKIKIVEDLANSLINNRTITLTLPANAAWVSGPVLDTAASSAQTISGLNNWSPVGSDGRTIKATITTSTNSDAATLILKDAEVTIAPGFTGDLKVAVGGSQGLKGDLVLGTVKPSVSVSAASKTDVKIGVAAQAVADITITEAAAGNIGNTVTYSWKEKSGSGYIANSGDGSGNAEIVIEAPRGVTFASTPKVEVTAGDLVLYTGDVDTDTTDDGKGLLIIPVKSSSNTASTIKISDIKLTVDRTVPEGTLSLAVKGTALDETIYDEDTAGSDTSSLFTGHTIASVAVANVVTPAPVDQKKKVTFKIGDNKFNMNGVDVTMDVAPYIKDGRTYLPLRYVAQALGVADANILWDQATKKVTLIKGTTFVQLTIGSNVMMVNGMPITMDVAPEISSDRTCLPIRFVAQVFGASVGWDAATQTVTIE